LETSGGGAGGGGTINTGSAGVEGAIAGGTEGDCVSEAISRDGDAESGGGGVSVLGVSFIVAFAENSTCKGTGWDENVA
jgi:hypothetical protein